jgi:hypothetical protein
MSNIAFTKIVSELYATNKLLNRKLDALTQKMDSKIDKMENHLKKLYEHVFNLDTKMEIILSIFFPPSNTVNYDSFNAQAESIKSNINAIKQETLQQLQNQETENEMNESLLDS